MQGRVGSTGKDEVDSAAISKTGLGMARHVRAAQGRGIRQGREDTAAQSRVRSSKAWLRQV